MEDLSSSRRHHAATTIEISIASHQTPLARAGSTHPIGITPVNGRRPNTLLETLLWLNLRDYRPA
jgi:hypothetical protein